MKMQSKQTVRVWFNHWFSTAYYIINLLKQDEQIHFYVIGSNERRYSVIEEACDEWYMEPTYGVNEEEYIDYCLEFCKEHEINVFAPRRGMLAVVKHRHLFEAIGVKILADPDYEKLKRLNNKKETYRFFEQMGIGNVPPYYVVNHVEDFKRAYERLTNQFRRVCIKFTEDEGATSFRVIDNRMEGYNSLFTYPGMKMSYEALIEALSEQTTFKELMVMPYLEGEEVSIDCLKTPTGIIYVPRIKQGTRISQVEYKPVFKTLCEQFYERIGLEGPCNIQLRYHEGTPYLLEVNTRMSGGIQQSCLAAQVNIPNIAINALLGNEVPWELCQETKRISYREEPVRVG